MLFFCFFLYSSSTITINEFFNDGTLSSYFSGHIIPPAPITLDLSFAQTVLTSANEQTTRARRRLSHRSIFAADTTTVIPSQYCVARSHASRAQMRSREHFYRTSSVRRRVAVTGRRSSLRGTSPRSRAERICLPAR